MKKGFGILKYFILTAFISALMIFSAMAAENVVFLKDGGTGDGSSEGASVGNLKAAYDALDLSGAATVVLCGPFTQSEDFSYGSAFSGCVTFTSVYGGIDYRESAGAVWQFDSVRMACYGETCFENISFVSTGAYYRVVAQHSPVTLGEGVSVSGENLTGNVMAESFVILGGYDKNFGTMSAINKKQIDISVYSGQYIYIVAYSHDISGVYRGVSNIVVGGDAEVGTVHGSCAYPDGIAVGDVKVTLKDNALIRRFYCSTQDTTVNSVEFNWESGDIHALKWSNSQSHKVVINNPTLLRASNAAMASRFYGAVSGCFDAVITAKNAGRDVTFTALTEEEKAALDSRAGTKAYNAYTFSGGQGAQISMPIPASGASSGKAYLVSGDYIHPVDADAMGNGHMGFDLEKDGIYICSASDFITYGDINSDGVIDVVDTMLTIKILLGDSGLDIAAADIDHTGSITLIDALRQFRLAVEGGNVLPTPEIDEANYNIISKEVYRDKTMLGFLSQPVGLLSGYEFARDKTTNLPLLGMPDSYFELLNGPFAEYNEINPREDKLVLNAETGIWETWMDDDFSIDILNQYILRDMYAEYGKFNTKVITDGWIKYDVYDMGGGNRDIGAYGLMNRYRYLSIFSGNVEAANNFNVNGEPYIGNETLGMSAAGMPETAIELAHKFGSATSDRDPLMWLKMFASMYSMAYFEDDIPTLIRRAQSAVMPSGSWQSYVVDKCFELYARYPGDWRSAVTEADTLFRAKSYDNQSYMGCTSINCSFIVLGLLYGEGDYYNTCKIIALSGHGGDSTTPTALGIVGVICGWESLDAAVKSTVNEKLWQNGSGIIVNRAVEGVEKGYWMHLAGLGERIAISDIIDMYIANFESVLCENGGFEKDGYYYIPKQELLALDTAYAESFEVNGIGGFTALGGSISLSDTPYQGSNSLALSAGGGESLAYTAVSGLKVGSTYKLSAFIRTTEGVTAHMFARECGGELQNYVTAHDPGSYITRYTVGVGANDMRSYVRRDLVFEATSGTMEIGLMLPEGTEAGGNVSFDEVTLTRTEETPVGELTVEGALNERGAYNDLITFKLDGGAASEAWLKLTYASNTEELYKVATLVNRTWQSRTPVVPTNGGRVTVYIPVLTEKEQGNTVSLFAGDVDITVYEAEIVTLKERF